MQRLEAVNGSQLYISVCSPYPKNPVESFQSLSPPVGLCPYKNKACLRTNNNLTTVRFLKTCFSCTGIQCYLFGCFVSQPQNSQEFTKW
eukprot:COSAG02_NODE_650_length_18912_cov_23.728698_7_plen_89_part_00